MPEKKPAVAGCSNWTSFELSLPKCRDDPRRVVWAANRREGCQRPTTSQRDMSEKSHCRSRHNQQECRPGGRVCLPQTPKRQEVRAKTHVSAPGLHPSLGGWPEATVCQRLLLLLFLNLGRSSRGGGQKLILEIITLMVNHPSGSHQQSSRAAG